MLKKDKKITFGAFAIAFLFLFNPNIAIVDPLPDFFGYMIICFALSRLAFLNETLYDAKRAFERMVLVDAGKILAIFWIFGIEAISERNTGLLLWSFVFGVLESIFAIPAFIKLFDGFSALGDFHVNTSIHSKGRVCKKSYTDFVKYFSVIFVVFKALLTCLPELTVLQTTTYDETSQFFSLYRYIAVIRGLCFVPVFIVGLIWLVTAVRYFLRISKDKTFLSSLNAEYAKKRISKNGLFVIKDVKTASLFFLLAGVLTIDFNLDGINILPDILVAVCMGLAFFYFAKTAKIKKTFPVICFALYTVATLFEDFIRYYFAENYYYNAIEKDGKAFTVYIITVIAVAIEGITLILLYSSIAKALRVVIKDHTGYVLGREIESDSEKKQIAEVQKRLSKNFSFVVDAVILCVLADTFYSLYGAFYAFLNKNFGWMSLISIVAGFILIGLSIKAVSELKEAVRTKYMLE